MGVRGALIGLATKLSMSCVSLLTVSSSLHSSVYAMDPVSMRALACAAKRPLGQVSDVIVSSYLEEHRSATLLVTTPEPPENRCTMKVGRGRCRKPVTRVALVQYCWKHQPGGGICFPGDSSVCHWNFHKLLQRDV